MGRFALLGHGILGGGLVLVVVYCICIHMVQRRRPPSPNNSLLVLGSWPASSRMLVPFLLTTLVLIPDMAYVFANLAALLFKWAEGWPFEESLIYVLDTLCQTGPATSLTPVTAFGTASAVCIWLLTFTHTSIIIGLSSIFSVNGVLSSHVPRSKLGFFLTCISIPPLFCTILGMAAFAVSVLDDSNFGESFLYLLSVAVGIQNPLTAYAPEKVTSKFVVGLVSFIVIVLVGVIVGVVGSHPQMGNLLILLEGCPSVASEHNEYTDVLHAEISKLTKELQQKTEALVLKDKGLQEKDKLLTSLRAELEEAHSEVLRRKDVELQHALASSRAAADSQLAVSESSGMHSPHQNEPKLISLPVPKLKELQQQKDKAPQQALQLQQQKDGAPQQALQLQQQKDEAPQHALQLEQRKDEAPQQVHQLEQQKDEALQQALQQRNEALVHKERLQRSLSELFLLGSRVVSTPRVRRHAPDACSEPLPILADRRPPQAAHIAAELTRGEAGAMACLREEVGSSGISKMLPLMSTPTGNRKSRVSASPMASTADATRLEWSVEQRGSANHVVRHSVGQRQRARLTENQVWKPSRVEGVREAIGWYWLEAQPRSPSDAEII